LTINQRINLANYCRGEKILSSRGFNTARCLRGFDAYVSNNGSMVLITKENLICSTKASKKLLSFVTRHVDSRDVTESANICIRWMRISCAKSVGCGFVARSKLPAIIDTAIQLRYLKLNSCKQTSSEQLK